MCSQYYCTMYTVGMPVNNHNHVFYRFSWQHTSVISGESLATVTWDIPSDAIPGTYRIQHFGYHKELANSKYFRVFTYQ